MNETVVFVLDVSGSMYGNRWKSLQMAIWRYIDDATDGQRLGMVLFDDHASTRYQITEINNPNIRAGLRDAVPDTEDIGGGGTNIGGGLRQGLAALRHYNPDTEGAIIFLVTDGEDFNTSYLDQVLPDLLAAKIIVRCLAIGKEADQNLSRLADATGGNVVFLPDVGPDNREMAERVMSAAMKEVVTSHEMAEVVVIGVYNDILTIDEGRDECTVRVPIDRDIGRNTSLQVLSHDIDSLIVDFKSPDGGNAGQFAIDNQLKRARLFVDQCETGVWQLTLTKQPGFGRKAISAQVVVESEIAGNGSDIELYVGIRGPEANCPPLLVCRLDKGGSPVVGARLTATVDRPDGTQTHTPLDRFHNDGYYYNYYTEYCGQGFYNVSVLAVSDGPNTTYRDNEVGEFRRQRVEHSFQMKQAPPPIPPDDRIFGQLVANGAFANLRHKNNVEAFVDHVEPIAQPAQPPRQMITSEMVAIRGKLSIEYIKVKKAINNSTLSKEVKEAKLDELADFDAYLTSARNTKQDEIDKYRQRLVVMRDSL